MLVKLKLLCVSLLLILELILKAEHIFTSNGAPVGFATGLTVFRSAKPMCPALYHRPGSLFTGLPD
jgi:hypothetical protein